MNTLRFAWLFGTPRSLSGVCGCRRRVTPNQSVSMPPRLRAQQTNTAAAGCCASIIEGGRSVKGSPQAARRPGSPNEPEPRSLISPRGWMRSSASERINDGDPEQRKGGRRAAWLQVSGSDCVQRPLSLPHAPNGRRETGGPGRCPESPDDGFKINCIRSFRPHDLQRPRSPCRAPLWSARTPRRQGATFWRKGGVQHLCD